MAELYSYNGIFLPGMEFDPVTYDYILRKHATVDIYYMRRSAPNVRYLCYSDGTVGHNTYVDHSKEASKWSGDDFWYNYDGSYPGGIPLENVLWSYNDILYEDGTVAVKGSKPTLVSDDSIKLEATYTGNLEVTAFGATGIYVGAQIRHLDTDDVVDISDKATYSIFSVGAGYASLDANRQVIINEDCPLNSIGVEITWGQLPNQTATLTVFISIDEGGGEGGEGGGGGGETGGDDPEETVTAEERRLSFWKGFGALAGMYGGGVAVAGDTGQAAAASSGGSELSKLFWLGGACGAAMYGGGRFNT